ncbi:MAG: autotransporter outer membrane beta-barrel domain-containing protein, partial [Geminicoccaceae bacterium]
FTPRLAGGPIEVAKGVSVDRGSLLKARVAAIKNDRQGQALKFAQSHDLGAVALDLSAIAGFAERDEKNLESASTLGFGGGLRFDSLGGLRLDASYSHRDELLGLARDRVTAGLGYNFGALDTRVSVSNVSQYDIDGVAGDEQQVWALGGQMQLSSSFVVGGDLAYSTSPNGSADTSGVVNFRFNF